MARIALVPVFIALLFWDSGSNPWWRAAAAAVFVIAAATDRLDGHLARSRNLVTEFGKLLDPIADKLLIGSALVALGMLGDVPWWVVLVILVREVGITVWRLVLVRNGVIPASRGGKIKTVLQIIAIGLFILPLWLMPAAVTLFAWLMMSIAIGVTVITGLDYVISGWRMGRDARA